MLSWLPFLNAWVLFLGLVSIFLWKWYGMLLFLVLAVVSVVYLIHEVVLSPRSRYVSAFWLFILSEAIIFVTLLFTALWNEEGGEGAISDMLELPFLGCFLLLSSSLTATCFHHWSFFTREGRIFLGLTVFLGVCFIILQLREFYICKCDMLYSAYMGAAFCAVGLHFSHVLAGVIALANLFNLGERVGRHYVNLIVWYWHFVDYVWLAVYLVIYCTF